MWGLPRAFASACVQEKLAQRKMTFECLSDTFKYLHVFAPSDSHNGNEWKVVNFGHFANKETEVYRICSLPEFLWQLLSFKVQL